jgi:hypothetical protein
MKPFTFYHLSLGALFVALLYFAIFSVLSLVEMGRLEKRVETLSTELGRLRGHNADLSRLLALQTNQDSATVSLAHHGWKKSNEILISIEPPVVATPTPAKNWTQGWLLWIALGVTALLSLFMFWRSSRWPRRQPRVQILDAQKSATPRKEKAPAPGAQSG